MVYVALVIITESDIIRNHAILLKSPQLTVRMGTGKFPAPGFEMSWKLRLE